MRSNLFWLSDEQWARIEPHLPTDVRGKERVDDRRIISGIVHVLKSGCRWKDCPAEYGPHTTVYNRFTRWAERGVWEGLFRAQGMRNPAPRAQMLDGFNAGWIRFEGQARKGSLPLRAVLEGLTARGRLDG